MIPRTAEPIPAQVAKHVGGFCIWQTQTTEYGIRNTPWRGGKGDIVKELSDSCRRRRISADGVNLKAVYTNASFKVVVQ